MKFVDYVTITVRSGKGGAGAMSFHRAKYVPLGGPDGGNGGQGGSVILRGDNQLYTLLDLRYNRHHFAQKGGNGQGNLKSGKAGEDIVLRVPLGTIAKSSGTEEVLAEIVDHGQEIVLAQGGRGGKGNDFFKTSTNQAPRHFQPGEPAIELEVTLELKLMADVGLVGFPNAGKSTIVASLSAARPKIADYPFTTLAPSLGVVSVGEYQSFVIADIPGIIEGAHEGKGLGIQFLKHIERNAVLLFVLPLDGGTPAEEFETLMAELEAFNPDLMFKPRMIALSKLDIIAPDERDRILEEARASLPGNETVVAISAVAHMGLDRLREQLWERVQKEKVPE